MWLDLAEVPQIAHHTGPVYPLSDWHEVRSRWYMPTCELTVCLADGTDRRFEGDCGDLGLLREMILLELQLVLTDTIRCPVGNELVEIRPGEISNVGDVETIG